MKRVFPIVSTLLLLVGIPTLAADLSGSNDPEFRASVKAWLEDNDAESLPVLSELARNGNVAARLLLARIEVTSRAPSEFVRKLTREAYLEIFRSGTGSGTFQPSWLITESRAGNQLARTFLDATALGLNMEGVRELFEIGEYQATEYLIKKISVDGTRDQRQELLEFIGPGFETTPYVRGFLHSREGMTAGFTALQHILGQLNQTNAKSIQLSRDTETEAAIKYLRIGYQAGKETIAFDSENSYFKNLSNWAMNSTQTGAIAAICRQFCSKQEIPACANTVVGLMGGYYEVVRTDSPFESIIPQDVYMNSKRAFNSVLRKIAAFRSEAGEVVFDKDQLMAKSGCLASALDEFDYLD